MFAPADRYKRSPEYLRRHIQSTGGTARRENASIDAGETEFCLEDHFRGHWGSDHAHLPVLCCTMACSCGIMSLGLSQLLGVNRGRREKPKALSATLVTISCGIHLTAN
jgi:hypothetical protein